MKRIFTTMLCAAMFCAPSGAKEKKQEDKKPAKTVKVASDLKPNRSYNIKSGDVVWTISDDTTKVVGLKTTIQKKDKKNALQQFAFVSTNGSTFYLYNIGAKAFVGKDGALSQTPNNPIKIKEGKKKGEITLSFADTLVFQAAKKGKVLILDKVPQKGDNALVEITFAQEFNPVQATSLVEDVNYQREVSHGLFNVKKGANNEWFWDIPDSLIGRRILLTVRFTGTPAGTQKYGGELVKQQTVYWELSPKNELLLRAEALMNVADSASAINRAVEVSSINPIMASFKVIHHKKGLRRINVTPLFNADDAAMGFSTSQKQNFGLSGFNPNLSYIENIKTFPMNTEVRTVKTWGSATAKNLAGARAGKVTIGLNYSFVLLPSDLMQRRYFDPRVGYFADRFVRFSDNQQRVENERFIVRYRLEPKDSADAERMKRGELIEPKKQIVYYIDPATPKQWRKYLIQGVNDWQKAFEQAGWKNAIVGKEWPENDPSMSLEDARFSVIRYLASDIPNAYGPNVHDPRTGEIIESHVCWYHNVMTLVHDWYMVQAANIDEAARKMNFDEELMGELIRFVSSHEVGHSMGLRHNFGSSSTVPVDSLRNKAWVEKFGHTPSIMDYARFNYVAQPEDSISRLGIFPRIGDYDTWAIEWGYRPMFAPNAQADHEALEQLFKEKHDKNPRLWFGDGETNKTNDSRCLTEDLGDDAIKASEYGILNLKRSIKNLQAWSYDKKDIYNTNLKTIYESHLTQLVRYTNHVIRNLGGVYANFKTIDQEGDVYSYVSRERHKEVMEYVSRNIATEPTWLIAEPYVKRFHPTPQSITENFGKTAMTSLLNACGQLTEVYTPSEYLTDLRKMLFTEATTGSRVSAYRQTLQRAFVSTLCAELKTMSVNNKLQAPFLATLRQLKTQLQNTGADSETRAHFAALTFTIEQALKPNL